MRNPDRAGRRREDEKNRIRRFYIMLLARRNNSVSNWLNSWFNDNFFDTSLMPHMNATAPAVNVKESATAYTMEVAAPGLKKDMVKMNIDKDGYLNVSIENKEEKKGRRRKSITCVVSSLTAATLRVTLCQRMLIRRRFPLRSVTVS